MRLFTRDERAVVLFLTASIVLGSLVLAARRVDPAFAPDLDPVPAGEARVAETDLEPGPIDVNTANEDDLVRLPGIGPVRAREIVRLREERGGFTSLDDLLDVKGIGPKTLEALRPGATASGPTTLPGGGAVPARPDTGESRPCSSEGRASPTRRGS